MHWHGNGNGLGQGEVERVQLEDERARISMRLRMLVLSVAQEARQARERQGKARWQVACGEAKRRQWKRKGKPGRLRRADWVGYCYCCCARGWGPKNCATPAMQGKVNYGSCCFCCCRCCCCCHCCACCAVAPKSEIKIK